MAAIDEVVKTIDETISRAQVTFEDQFHVLKAHQEKTSGPISFSSTKGLTQQCVACGKGIVNYAVFGRIIEGEKEGFVNISWNCNNCKKRFVFIGSRSLVVDKLLHLSYQPKAA